MDDIFSKSFWRATLNNVVHGAASGALTVLGVGAVGDALPTTHISVPFWTIFMAAVGGAFLSLILSLTGQKLPNTGLASVVPADAFGVDAKKTPAKKVPAKKRATKQPPPRTAM